MSKIKYLWIFITVLVVLNMALLLTLYLGAGKERPRHGGRGEEGPKRYIIEKLHFNDEQIKIYEGLIAKHRQTIDKADMEIRETKEKLYHLLTNQDDHQKDSLLAHIVQLESTIEYTHFNHFKDIKSLCKPDQMGYFNELSQELVVLFSHPEKKK